MMNFNLLNIGFGNVVMGDKVVAIISPESAPIKRLVQDARDGNTLIDATFGRKTRSVLVMDNGWIILSALQPETISHRIVPAGSDAAWKRIRKQGKKKRSSCVMNDSGLLIVVSGPSGAGKGTICSALREQFPNIQYSISMTTRKPRPGEVDGVNYYFADNARFEQLLAEDAFLEHAKVYDHYYGTPKKYVYQMLEEGKHVMLEIDIQGAMQVKKRYPQGVFIYIVPPSRDVLEKRLRGRQTDSDDVIAGRLAKARAELDWIDRYDYVIVNDELEKAVDEAASILKAEQCKVTRNAHRIAHTKELYK